MIRNRSYFTHYSVGHLIWKWGEGTKHYQPYWSLVICDQDIVDYYVWHCKKRGMPIMKNTLYGSHISFLKGEKPNNFDVYGKDIDIPFWYSDNIRTDNDFHAWLDIWSDELADLRQKLGLSLKYSYHLTLGRLV